MGGGGDTPRNSSDDGENCGLDKIEVPGGGNTSSRGGLALSGGKEIGKVSRQFVVGKSSGGLRVDCA